MTWYGMTRWLRMLKPYPSRFAGWNHAYRYYRCLLRVPNRWLGQSISWRNLWYWKTKFRSLKIVGRDVSSALHTHWTFRHSYWSLRPAGR
jgi:hypothetical protein